MKTVYRFNIYTNTLKCRAIHICIFQLGNYRDLDIGCRLMSEKKLPTKKINSNLLYVNNSQTYRNCLCLPRGLVSTFIYAGYFFVHINWEFIDIDMHLSERCVQYKVHLIDFFFWSGETLKSHTRKVVCWTEDICWFIDNTLFYH